MTTNSNDALNRIEQKLATALDSGQFYEANQIYRTLYYRLCGQSQLENLADKLFDGIMKFSDSEQYACVGDLALLYIDVLSKSKTKVGPDVISRLEQTFNSILNGGKDLEVVREKFDHDSVNWSANENCKSGNPLLHLKFGKLLWKNKDYTLARRHLMLSDDEKALTEFLINHHQNCGKEEEYDLFLAQAVFQLLCRRKESMASSVFRLYVQHHPQLADKCKSAQLCTPLLDFTKFLLESLSAGQLSRFSVLVEKYSSSLERDAAFKGYLDKIGQIYFGLPPPQPAPTSFLANLVKDMLKPEADSQNANGSATEPKIPLKPKANLQEDDLD